VKTLLAGIAAATALALAPSCAGEPTSVRAARDLEIAFSSIVEAVEAGDRAAAKQAVQQLVVSVDRWKGAQALDQDRADAILAAAEVVLNNLALLPAPLATPSADPPLHGADESEEGDSEEDDNEEEGGSEGTPGEDKGKKKGHDKD
jgi:hypothetical protein